MMPARRLVTLAFFFLLSLTLTPGQALALDLVEGKHYEVIAAPITPKGSKPEVVEVFNFKCPHCFKLHPHMTKWASKNHDKYDIKALPIYWGKQTDAPVRAYYAGLFLKKGEAMKNGIFRTQFKDQGNIEDIEELAFVAEEAGLDPVKFKKQMRAFGVTAKVSQAKSLQRSFGVNSTPTIVINGRYKIHPGKHAKGDMKRLFQIVEELAAR
ncbi:MAG: thiol:disulfide interchange protein DsbA/DsbL [Magnetococcales bacterium]|nr:thiol:disulfide interchange protein DsbA/DsbL [Magnetococcales bacterium]